MSRNIYIILVMMAALVTYSLYGQQINPSDLYLNAETNDFATIKHRVEQYYQDKDKGQGTGYKQWKRWENFMKDRLTSDGKITNVTARNWEAYYTYIQSQQGKTADNTLAANGDWHSLGPTNLYMTAGKNPGLGRVNVIAFHPTIASTFWIGTPAGGLWETTTGGVSWTPMTDGMPLIGISGIAVDYTNPNVIYILSGDGDGGHTKSIGVFKTINGGETWLSTGLSWSKNDQVGGFKLTIHPTNNLILFSVSNMGIHKTSNGGLTWTLVKSGLFYDIEFKPDDPSTIYVSGSTTFWRSTDTGNTWSGITSGLPTGCNRIAVSVTPANPNYVYLLAGPATTNGHFKGVYRSTDAGLNFTLQSEAPNILGWDGEGNDNMSQSTWDLAMAVSRTNANQVICGGVNTWKNLAGGLTGNWVITSHWLINNDPGYTHADIHDLAINPLNNYLYCASDGSFYLSTDFGENWTNLTIGLDLTQWYRIAGTPLNPNYILGGTQDIGSNLYVGNSIMAHLWGGDGQDCMMDYSDLNIMYYSQINGDLVKSGDGGYSCYPKRPPGSIGGGIRPLIMNPVIPTIIYAGYENGIFKSSDGGESWSNIGNAANGAMAIGTDLPTRIYAAFDTPTSHDLWRTDNAGNTWYPIHNGLPAFNITGIDVNPANSLKVFVTIAGYNAGQKVYYSPDGGVTWTNISGSLPDVAMTCIAYENTNNSPPDAIYIGTDIGVFYRNNTLGDWIPFMNGMPTTIVRDFVINTTTGTITAATFGRGLWQSPLYTSCPPIQQLTPGNDPSNPNFTGFQFYGAGNWISSSRSITGGIGTNVTYKAGTYVRLTTGFHAKVNNRFQATLGPCQPVGIYQPIKKQPIGIYDNDSSYKFRLNH